MRRVVYSYKNNLLSVTKLWLSWPKHIHHFTTTKDPLSLSNPDQAGNQLGYYELQEKESIQIRYMVDSYIPNKSHSLTNEEKTFYLRSTELVPITNDIKELAQSLVKDTTSIYKQAYILFEHLVLQYSYLYPPKERGALSFLRDKKGDCGEFSFLYSALCRSLGIPCRTMIGCWAVGSMQAHVWNEVFIEGKGWLPVDCSMANVQKKKPWQFVISSLRTLQWKKYFGETEGQRIVFSIDTEIPLTPIYPSASSEILKNYPKYAVILGGKPLVWGYETFHDTAPFMQPAYIKFHEENLTHNSFKSTVQAFWLNPYFGRWTVYETGWQRFLYILKHISGFLAVIMIGLHTLFPNDIFLIIQQLSLILLSLSFVLRKERMVLFGILTTIFLLFTIRLIV